MKKITPRAWKARYYPISAGKVSKKNALEHSIHKWIGLLLYGNVANLEINDETCALCKVYIVKTGTCSGCPLYESRGKMACDAYSLGYDNSGSPYGFWTNDKNALPMVRALMKARDWEEANKP